MFGAEIVTRENRSLIGKEINDNSVPEVTYSGERCIKQIDKNPIDNSNIIKGVANENIVLPSSISEFEVKNICLHKYFLSVNCFFNFFLVLNKMDSTLLMLILVHFAISFTGMKYQYLNIKI